MRTLTAYERDLIAGGTLTGSTDGTGGGGGGGDPPPSDPPGSDEDDYAYAAFFDDEMDALENDATEFTFYVPVAEVQPSGGGGGGSGGGGGRGGYDSADYNGPAAGYIDYFATQHGPDSIEVRAALSSAAFFNYAQHQDQIRGDLTNIVRNASDAATANQQIAGYLGSRGLAGQLNVQINDTGVAAAQQAVQQPGPNTGNDIIVNGSAYRVGTPNTIVSFGSEGQFMLASYMPPAPQEAQVYGSIDGVPASKKHPGQYRLPKNMTDAQKAAVVYNETKGIEDPAQRQMVAAMVMKVIANNVGRSYLAASPQAVVSGSAQQAAWTAAVNAVQQYSNILASLYDMYNPMAEANIFVMRRDYSMEPGGPGTTPLPVLAIYGPFNASGSPYHYIRFFKDPTYANAPHQ